MTQDDETFIPVGAVAATSQEYYDVWHNPTDQTFIVAVHHDHNIPRGGRGDASGPRATYFRLLPKKDTLIPKEHRRAVQTYECAHPDCRSSAGSKVCLKDHPAIVSGGQCPQAIRKGAPHIRPNALFSSEFRENSIPANGAIPGKSGGDNRAELQAKLEKIWQKVTREPPSVTIGQIQTQVPARAKTAEE